VPGEGRRSRLVSIGPFVAGLVIGLAIGVSLARAVVQLIQPVSAAAPVQAVSPASPPPSPSPPARASPATPAAPASPSPSPAPSASSLLCPALAAGQPSLDQLEPAPAGYAAEAPLGWLGCGSAGLPPGGDGGVLHLAQQWLLAVAYTCPLGTAGSAPGTTISVVETTAGSPVLLAGESGDAGRAIVGGTGAVAFAAGSPHLEVQAPAACLWHIALYVAQS
jgi:hypothetical protein